MAQKLTIEFKPKGDQALIAAVKQMDVATKRLQGKTSQYEDELKKLGLTQVQVNKVLKSGTKNLRIQAGAFATIRSNLLLYAFALGLVTKGFQSLFSTYIKQEKAEKKLSAALGETNRALLNQASALQSVTEFGDEAIIEVQALIGAFTKDEEQIKSLTKATLDLAAAKGMDLKAAADLVAKSFGSSTNSLSRYGVEVNGVVGSSQRLESLTSNISELFGGQAAASAETLGGSVEQMKNAMGDASEAIGQAFAPFMKELAGLLTDAAQGAKSFFLTLSETPLDRTIRELQELGENTTEFEKISSRIKVADAWKEAGVEIGNVGKLDEEILSLQHKINSSGKSIVVSLKNQGTEYKKLVIEGHKIEDLEKAIREDSTYTAISGKTRVDQEAQRARELLKAYNIQVKNQEIFEEDLTGQQEKLALLIKVKQAIEESNKLFEEGSEKDSEGFLAKIFGKFAEPDEMAAMADNVQMWSKSVLDIGDSYLKLQTMQMNQAKQEELDAVKSIRNEKLRQKEIDKINKKYEGEQEKINKKSKQMKRAQTVINTATGIMEVWADKDMPNTFAKIAMSAMVAALGATQLGIIDAQKYQYGGAVGGRRHSQGGTIIEAEQGEFVVSRSGVESVGIETLNRINAGGGGVGGSSIIINNPIIGKDTIEDEIVPQIKEALRRGGDIGI